MAVARLSLGPRSAQDPDFEEPPWQAPLDYEAVIARIPESATISGMFAAPLVAEARRLLIRLPSARDRYVPFSFYPLREHARLLVEAAAALYPERSPRLALRSLGRAAPQALVASTLGKVVFAGVHSVHEAIVAMSNSYAINVRPSRATVIESRANRAVIRLENVYYFLDCHHVGAYEGLLRYVQVKGRVLLRSLSPDSIDLLVEW